MSSSYQLSAICFPCGYLLATHSEMYGVDLNTIALMVSGFLLFQQPLVDISITGFV